MKQITFLLFVLFISVLHTKAQVTIGSNLCPEKGALLQIKDIEPDLTNLTPTSNITATRGGFALPRVSLLKANSLEPFIEEKEQTAVVKLLHVGLMVYNINIVDSEKLLQGIYVWDGEKWNTTGSTGGSAGCVDKDGVVDADCDGYNKNVDPDDHDPCTPQTKVELEYIENGVLKSLNSSAEITVKRGTSLSIQLKSLIGSINKRKWSNGSTGSSISVNTNVEDPVGKEYSVMVNNCASEGESLKRVHVKVVPDPCYLDISGGSTVQRFDLGSTTNPFVPINISTSGENKIIIKEINNTYAQGIGISYDKYNESPSIIINKGDNPTTPGYIQLALRSSNELCNNEHSTRELLVTYGSKTPKVKISINNYKQTQNYTSEDSPNMGEVTLFANVFENKEYAKEIGFLIKTYQNKEHPPVPTPIRGGSFKLYDGKNMDQFVNHPIDSNNPNLTLKNIASNQSGDRMVVLAYVKGVDDLFFYSQPRYITACEYNYPDIRKCNMAGDRVSNWGLSGAVTEWTQWEASITSNKKGDGYNRDGNNVGTYKVVNILTYPNREETGKYDWWFTQNVYNEHNLIYGGSGQYTAPGATPASSNPWIPFSNIIGPDPATDTERKMAERYGFLYRSELFEKNVTWYNALCPPGWHGATESDWTGLLNTIQDVNKPLESSYPNTGASMKIEDDYAIYQNGLWNQQTTNNKTNYLGISILPSGFAAWGYGRDNQGIQASFFSMRENKTFLNRTFNSSNKDIIINNSSSHYGRSIRCVRQ